MPDEQLVIGWHTRSLVRVGDSDCHSLWLQEETFMHEFCSAWSWKVTPITHKRQERSEVAVAETLISHPAEQFFSNVHCLLVVNVEGTDSYCVATWQATVLLHANWLARSWYDEPRIQSAHSRSEVKVGDCVMACPGKHVEMFAQTASDVTVGGVFWNCQLLQWDTFLHEFWPGRSWYVKPREQFWHSRSDVAVGNIKVLCPAEQIVRLLQVRSEEVVGARAWYWLGVHKVAFVQEDCPSVEEKVKPSVQFAHTRSDVAVFVWVSACPKVQLVREWHILFEERVGATNCHSTSTLHILVGLQ